MRRLHDTRVGGIFLTGSSSRLLTREIATGLRGRCLAYEVFPLSFAEFLAFRGLALDRYAPAAVYAVEAQKSSRVNPAAGQILVRHTNRAGNRAAALRPLCPGCFAR